MNILTELIPESTKKKTVNPVYLSFFYVLWTALGWKPLTELHYALFKLPVMRNILCVMYYVH